MDSNSERMSEKMSEKSNSPNSERMSAKIYKKATQVKILYDCQNCYSRMMMSYNRYAFDKKFTMKNIGEVVDRCMDIHKSGKECLFPYESEQYKRVRVLERKICVAI